jgi:hypothetical protein
MTPGAAGTRNAARVAVRVALMLLCAACAGSMRPAVIPKLSELPAEPERRNTVLDSAHARPGPEQQPVSKKARKVETAAATAAAWIGILLSDHENVVLGAEASFDENQLVDPKPKQPEKQTTPVEHDGALVPWIQLK